MLSPSARCDRVRWWHTQHIPAAVRRIAVEILVAQLFAGDQRTCEVELVVVGEGRHPDHLIERRIWLAFGGAQCLARGVLPFQIPVLVGVTAAVEFVYPFGELLPVISRR